MHFLKYTTLLLILLIISVLSCNPKSEYPVLLPSHFPPIQTLSDNPLSVAKIALGERLFHDHSLSLDSTISCASCHKKEFAFADNRTLSLGITGRLPERNTPSLYNIAYVKNINKDGGVTKLDIQALVPIEDHNEMGISIIKLAERLQDDEVYKELFHEAYHRDPDAYTIPRALASFVRTLISGNSKYDQYLNGNNIVLSPEEKSGLELFQSDRLQCTQCHSGLHLSNESFENNGLYAVYEDLGRGGITLNKKDYGSFRVPSLRNVELTAPYMHDGSIASLEQVIDHYASGGATNDNKSHLIKGFTISTQEKSDLLSFLYTLTEI